MASRSHRLGDGRTWHAATSVDTLFYESPVETAREWTSSAIYFFSFLPSVWHAHMGAAFIVERDGAMGAAFIVEREGAFAVDPA